jgi:hypothetical protein
MSILRTAAIRLAYENPSLRPHLLPLLSRTAVRKWKDKEKMQAYLSEHPNANPDNHEYIGGDEDGEGEQEKVVYRAPTKEQIDRARKEAPNTKWKKPDIEEEQGEIERTALDLGIDNYEDLMERAKKSKLEPLTDEVWSQLQNTDSYDTDTVKKADRLAREYNRDIASVFDGMGKELPAPIVLFRKGKRPYLVGGNTRLMASRAFGHTPKVLIVRM